MLDGFFIKEGENTFIEYKPSILIILGPGGHRWEMLDILSKFNFEYMPIYVIDENDQHSLNCIYSFEEKYKRKFFIERIIKPKYDNNVKWYSPIVLYRSFLAFLTSLKIIYSHKPEYLLSNGPDMCVPIFIAGRLLNFLDISKIILIYIESAARINTLSKSAKIIRYFEIYIFRLFLEKFLSKAVKPIYIFGFWKELCDRFSDKFIKLEPYTIQNKTINYNNNIINKKNKDKTILITVGTTQFKELIQISLTEKFQNLLYCNGYKRLIIQIGNLDKNELNIKKYNTDLTIEIISIIPSKLFDELIKSSDLIITHGGVGTVFQSIIYGKKPIVISNKDVSEDHQKELVEHLKKHKYIFSTNIEDIYKLFDEIKITSNDNNIKFKYELTENFLSKIRPLIGNNSYNYLKDNQISIVIPTTSKDIKYFLNLMKSIDIFVPDKYLDKIYLIIPDNDNEEFQTVIKNNKFKEKYIIKLESDIIDMANFSEFFLENRKNWFKQQILKLHASTFIKTKFYLILDSDCMFMDKLELNKMFFKEENGNLKAYLQIEELFKHEFWLKGSAKILGINSNFLESIDYNIGVTPQILSVDIVKELCSFLEQPYLGQKKWYNILWENPIQIFPKMIWTEYTLYYLFGLRSGMLDKYHICKRNCISDYYHCVWQTDESFEWNPKNSKNSEGSLITIFQSNMHLSHRIPKAFLSQYNQKEIKDFISCIMFLYKDFQISNNKIKNSIIYSIKCYINQIWPKNKRELIIYSSEENEKEIKHIIESLGEKEEENIKIKIINNKNISLLDILHNNKDISGDYISIWNESCWSSQYMLSIQYEFIIENNINNCIISPIIYYNEKNEIIEIIDNTIKINDINLSFFSHKNYFNSINENKKISFLNEPNILIFINNSNSNRNVNKLEKNDILFLKNEISRLVGPFRNNLSLISFSNKRKIYIISSELEFYPIIGGINTFLRVILSGLEESKINIEKNIEFIFCGIKCGKNEPQIDHIKGVRFKFFETPKSMISENLSKYFISFEKHSETMKDLQIFGKKAISWIINDANVGDVCISTIIYELDKQSIKNLNLKSIKLIHTVHSLVPFKILNNLRCNSLDKIDIRDQIISFFIKLFNIDESSLIKLSQNKILGILFPSFFKEVLDLEKNIMDFSKNIIIPSTKLSKITSNLYNSNKSKIIYVPWGLPKNQIIGESFINFEETGFDNGDYNEIITRRIKCLTLSKIIPQKGIDLLLDSFLQIEKMDQDFAKRLELTICGDNSFIGESKYMNLINSKIEKLKYIQVKKKGWVTGESKLKELKNANIFLLPSLVEPFGFCILEAMKAGLPIISFATEGPLDIIKNNFGRIINFSSDREIMIKDFAAAIIDFGYSTNFYRMKKNSNESLNNWEIIKLISTLISLV